MQAAKSLRNGFNKLLGVVNVALFAFMVVVGTYQILVRYLFNKPSTVSEELLTYAFTWMSLLAAAWVFGKREHMRMGFLADKLDDGKKRVLDMVIEVIIMVFAAIVLVYGGIQITSLTMSQKTASLGIPMGYIYVVVPICGVLILVYSVMNLMDLANGKNEQEPEEMGNRALEGRNREMGTRNRSLEGRNRSLETRNREMETRNRSLEDRNREMETRNRSLEDRNRDWRPGTGRFRIETGKPGGR